MVCIYCGGETRVTNSRLQKKINQTWRRRHCLKCDAIFTSTESAVLLRSLLVHKSGRSEPFSRDKLFLSIYDALKHRKTVLEDATALTQTILSKVYSHKGGAQVDKARINAKSYEALKRFDRAAAVQYRAYHPL